MFFRCFAGMPWTDVSRCRGGSAPRPLGKGLGGVDEIVERNMNEKLHGTLPLKKEKIEWKVTLSKTPSSWLMTFQCIPLFTGRINQVATFEESWKKICTLANQTLLWGTYLLQPIWQCFWLSSTLHNSSKCRWIELTLSSGVESIRSWDSDVGQAFLCMSCQTGCLFLQQYL